jgi:ABC-type antimicrobial peptide transport system permease subunit
MALGADRTRVLGLVLGSALLEVGIGLAVGIPVALVSGLVLARQLYRVKSYDPSILTLAAVILAVCAFLAASVPARRATRIDPLRALRYE